MPSTVYVYVCYLVERWENQCGCVFESRESVCAPQCHSYKEYGSSQQWCILHVHPDGDHSLRHKQESQTLSTIT